MLHNIVMPKLGESVTEGTVVKWLVKPGDSVKQYDNLLEVETAKVVAEVPATEDGVIKEILVKEGDTVAVGAVICVMEVTKNNAAENLSKDNDVNKLIETPEVYNYAKLYQEEQKNVVQDNISSGANHLSSSQASGNNNKLSNNLQGNSKARYSPVVLSLAQEHNIDLQQVKGTGFENRITRKDILDFIANIEVSAGSNIQADILLNKASSNNNVNAQSTAYNNDSISKSFNKVENNVVNTNLDSHKEASTVLNGGDKLIPVSAVRKAIAKKMVESVSNIPHAWLTIEVDATNLVKLRNRIKNEFVSKEGFPITYFAFFVTEIVKALQHFSLLNSVWQESNILLKKDINVSIAVAVENSLFVPVIKNADNKNIKGIAKEIYELANKAKSNTLSTSDMQGGTFTINNTGSFGSISSMGIINYPQAAILQVESIVKRPVVLDNNAIAIRDMVNLSLSIDHRIVDGLIAGSFLKQVKHNIENINSSIF